MLQGIWYGSLRIKWGLSTLRFPCQCLVSKYLPKRTLNPGLTCLLLLCHRSRLVLICLSATTFLRLQNLGKWSTRLMMVLMQFIQFGLVHQWPFEESHSDDLNQAVSCIVQVTISYRNSWVLNSVSNFYFLARRHFQLRTKSSWRWSIVKLFFEMVITRSAFPWEMHRLLCPTIIPWLSNAWKDLKKEVPVQ